MDYTTVYVGMDVHKETFSLCCYTNEKEKAEYHQTVPAHYSKVTNYLEAMRFHYGDAANFICGYEAGCLGYSLYRDLTAHNVKCVILAPTTMSKSVGDHKIKTDKRDAAVIARCLAHHDYSAVHVLTEKEERIKQYIRMRDDHKLALKKVKQQILSFCLQYGKVFVGTNHHWTHAHLTWLRTLELDPLDRETLSEYLLTYDNLTEKLARFEKRIEEMAEDGQYRSSVHKLSCFLGIKTHTALAALVEIGDFRRFAKAEQFAAYVGLVPGEHSSGPDKNRIGITKAGNCHVRTLLVEAAQSYGRGQPGYKSREIKKRQEGNPPDVIAYADKANERLRRRYYRLTLNRSKKTNVAKTAVARELACFVWGMMTERYA